MIFKKGKLFLYIMLILSQLTLLEAAVLCKDIKLGTEPMEPKRTYEEYKAEFEDRLLTHRHGFEEDGLGILATAPNINEFILALSYFSRKIAVGDYGRVGLLYLSKYPLVEKLNSLGELNKVQAERLLEALKDTDNSYWDIITTGIRYIAMKKTSPGTAIQSTYLESFNELAHESNKLYLLYSSGAITLPQTFVYELASLPQKERQLLQVTSLESMLKERAQPKRNKTLIRNYQYLHWLSVYPEIARQYDLYLEGKMGPKEFFAQIKEHFNPKDTSGLDSYGQLETVIEILQEELRDYIGDRLILFGSFPNMRAVFSDSKKGSDIDISISPEIGMELLNKYDLDRLMDLPRSSAFIKAYNRANERVRSAVKSSYNVLSLWGGLNDYGFFMTSLKERSQNPNSDSFQQYLSSVGRVSPVVIEIKKDSWKFELYKHFEEPFIEN